MKGTWRKEKQRKKERKKERRSKRKPQFSPNTHHKSVIFRSVGKHSLSYHKQGVRAVTHTVLTSAVVKYIDSKVYRGGR